VTGGAAGEGSGFCSDDDEGRLYDRDLADLFVLEGEGDLEWVAREGVYVNREMVKAGLARVWWED